MIICEGVEIYAYDSQSRPVCTYDAPECTYDGASRHVFLDARCLASNSKGKERDTETGNDDFGARYYSNRFGRWLSADWSAVPVPVPYANLSNPQTLNLYAMVADDPESFADLDGHSKGSDIAAEEEAKYDQQVNEAWDQAAQQQAAQAQERIAKIAEDKNGDASYSQEAKKDEFACGTNKCNKFVGDVTAQAGAQAVVLDPKTGKPITIAPGSDKPRPPRAGEWADPNTPIPNWRALGKNEAPQRGDVAAYKLPGGGASFSGHSGIVTSVDRNGTVHAMAAHGQGGVGPDSSFNRSPSREVVYRRFTGDQ